MSKIINFYSKNKPELNELVLVVFNLNCISEGFFKGTLIEYPYYNCIMNYHDATKKKKIISWNKIVLLNKNMVVKVDNIDINEKCLQVSIAYLYENIKKNIHIDNIQTQLLEYFQENKIMSKFINTLCINYNYDYNYLWTTLIYYIDTLRIQYNCDNNENISIWKYFKDNFNMIEEWLNVLNLNTYKDNIILLFNKKNDFIIKKIITKFGIISNNNILEIKQLFNFILSNFNFQYSLKYESTPYYIFESNNNDSDISDHDNFINKINKYIINKNIFIKIDYIGKII